MSAQHKSVFADYENRGKVELTFSEENPEKNYEFGDEIGRLVLFTASNQSNFIICKPLVIMQAMEKWLNYRNHSSNLRHGIVFATKYII
jgi:hypothetical protein